MGFQGIEGSVIIRVREGCFYNILPSGHDAASTGYPLSGSSPGLPASVSPEA